MRLSMQLFERELGNMVAGSSIKSDCFRPKIECSYLLEPNEPHLYSDILYIAPVSTLADVGGRVNRYLRSSPNLTFSCLCIGDPPVELVEARNCDIIWLDASTHPSTALNAVQRITRRHDVWERQLASIATSGGSIDDLVSNSIGIFKNDICVTDHLSRVLAYQVYRTNRLSREETSRIVPGSYLPKEMVIDGIMDEVEGRGFAGASPSASTLGFSRMRAFDCDVLQYTIGVRPEYSVILSVHANYQDVSPADGAPIIVLGEAIRRSCIGYGRL